MIKCESYLFFFTYMYRPRQWPSLAKLLSEAWSSDGTPILEHFLKKIELDTSVRPMTLSPHAAVVCMDSPAYSDLTDEAAFKELLERSIRFQRETSMHFGGLQPFAQLCQHTNVKAAQRYTGPFSHTLRNEILIIGNTADVTRHAIAKRNSCQ
ncbi:hypothetical protein SCHPADRAFT_141978 [Schizopora paradoxa]|uniref:Uncharacterized protein n=1 Tax=Schizopora paradoxa TaxID=27342 RepID=A0A0H2S1X7_9AGAM|nr:hypothetical protein SCHPADRAFT_141978 [Schizopora paradoxa]